ncbi:MAG TPA: NHL repeat-containing protein [Anaeromyxobacteraceae bacterium]|nr:NHL repeat-containing protein [Anaeromyxobacteraceae bacterium]
MRTLSITVVLVALGASLPHRASAAAPVGLRHELSIYTDSADVALRNPEGVACDEKGSLVVADTGNARLLVFRFKDGALDAGTQVKLAQLAYPTRVQIDGAGVVLALDRRTRRVVQVDANGTFAGYVEPQGVTTAPVNVTAFRVGAGGDLVLLDAPAAKVLVLAREGRVKRELPLPKGAQGVTDVAVDSSGRVYVLDAVSATVFVAEKDATAFKPLSASLKEQISFPTYLAPDDRGKLYVVDQNGNAIVKLGVDGSFQGRELATGWKDGGVYYPAQLCLGPDGDLIVADRNNDRVQIFSLPR